MVLVLENRTKSGTMLKLNYPLKVSLYNDSEKLINNKELTKDSLNNFLPLI